MNEVWSPFRSLFVARTPNQEDIRFNHNVIIPPSNQPSLPENTLSYSKKTARKESLKNLITLLKNEKELPTKLEEDLKSDGGLDAYLQNVDASIERSEELKKLLDEILLPRWNFLLSKLKEAPRDSKEYRALKINLSDMFKKFHEEHSVCIAGVISYLNTTVVQTDRFIDDLYISKTIDDKAKLLKSVNNTIRDNLENEIMSVSEWLRHISDNTRPFPQILSDGFESKMRILFWNRQLMLGTLLSRLVNLKEYNIHSTNILSKLLAPNCGIISSELNRTDDLETSLTGDYQLITEFSCIAKDARKKLPYYLYSNGPIQKQSNHYGKREEHTNVFFNNNDILSPQEDKPPVYYNYAKDILKKHSIDLENKLHRRKIFESATKTLGYPSILRSPLGQWAILQNLVSDRTGTEDDIEGKQGSIQEKEIKKEIKKIEDIEKKALNKRSDDDKIELESFYHTLDDILDNILKNPTKTWEPKKTVRNSDGKIEKRAKTFSDFEAGFFAYARRYSTWVTNIQEPSRHATNNIRLYREILTPLIALTLYDSGVLYKKSNHGPIEKSVEETIRVQKKTKSKPTFISNWVTHLINSISLIVTAPWRLIEALIPFHYKASQKYSPLIIFREPRLTITLDTTITLKQWLIDFAFGSIKNTILAVAYTPLALSMIVFNTAKFVVTQTLLAIPRLITPLKFCLYHAVKLVTHLLVTPFFIPYKLSLTIYKGIKPLASTCWKHQKSKIQAGNIEPPKNPIHKPLSPVSA